MTVIDFANPPGILLLMGLPGSGKSTLAHQWVAKDNVHRMRINFDDMREELYGPNWVFNRTQEDAMKVEAIRRARGWLEAAPLENAVVVDNLNLTKGAREPWIQMARSLGVPIDIHEMEANVVECVRHDRYRVKGRVGEAVINRWALTTGWIDWTEYKNPLMIVDVDGTLFDPTHRRHLVHMPEDHHNCKEPILQHGVCSGCGKLNPKHGWKKDWPAFFKAAKDDPPIEPIIDLVTELGMSYHVLIVSGRPIDFCGIMTEDALRKWKVPYEFLFMRSGGDGRPDTVVKQEILDYLPKDRIKFVLDDRDSVVKMWRDNGLTCLQVAPGDF